MRTSSRALDARVLLAAYAWMVVRGRSNTEIARTLTVAEITVKTHLAHILGKLGLRDRVHAVVYGYEHGLITPGATTEPA
jgi:DNA-binding CsgD family transcriptional regulator